MIANNTPAKRLIFNSLGIIFSVIPVSVSIFSYFPLWVVREDASILSGISLILMLAAFVPCFRYIKTAIFSASAPVMWLVIFITFFLLSKIADEITVIAFVGFLGNLIGAVFFGLARVKDDRRA